MSEPMSAERLARIRERAVRAACGKHKDDGWLFCRIDAPELLVEAERLRTAEESLTVENARLRAELEAAKNDLAQECYTCKHFRDNDGKCPLWGTKCRELGWKAFLGLGDAPPYEWEWRGVPANTPTQGEMDEARGGGNE